MLDIECIAILHTKAWSWVGFGLDCQWSGISSPYLSLFPSAFPLLQAPGQRRRQIPHLASQQWPRQAWHSSRIAVGPPSVASCKPYMGCPRTMGTIPSTLLSSQPPFYRGLRDFQGRRGWRQAHDCSHGPWAWQVGPATAVQSVAIECPSLSHGPPRACPTRESVSSVIQPPRSPSPKTVNPH